MSTTIGELFELRGGDKQAAAARAKQIFNSLDMDGNGHLEEAEFVLGCLDDAEFVRLLTDEGLLSQSDQEYEFDSRVPKFE